MKKTVLITGSTDGIGKLAANNLARDGHTVCLHGRQPEKLAAAVSEIKSITGNESIKGFLADFSDLEAVKRMAAQINKELPEIDILINNAGIFKSPEASIKGRLDIRFAVNYYAPYILTRNLMPLLNNGTDPRIINLSSAAQAPVSLEALLGKKRISPEEGYAQSKLALTMWSFYLAENRPQISVIAVNPGSLLNTKMVAEAYGRHWSPADKGADILYNLAISEDYKGVTGKYFDNDRGSFAQAHPDAYSKQKIDQLIQTTREYLNQ